MFDDGGCTYDDALAATKDRRRTGEGGRKDQAMICLDHIKSCELLEMLGEETFEDALDAILRRLDRDDPQVDDDGQPYSRADDWSERHDHGALWHLGHNSENGYDPEEDAFSDEYTREVLLDHIFNMHGGFKKALEKEEADAGDLD
jgi:hypothetical protein